MHDEKASRYFESSRDFSIERFQSRHRSRSSKENFEKERTKSKVSYYTPNSLRSERFKNENVYEFFPQRDLIKHKSLKTQDFYTKKKQNCIHNINKKQHANYENLDSDRAFIGPYSFNGHLDFFDSEKASRSRKVQRNESSRLPKRMYKFIDGAKNKISNLLKYY